MGVECSLKIGQLHVEVFFDDDAPAVNAKVEVVGDRENVVAVGYTDGKGLWNCSAPPAGKYSVVVDAGMGHRTKVPIVVPGVSSGQQTMSTETRQQFTGFPYLKVGLGLGAIFLFSVAFLLARKMNREKGNGQGTPGSF
jgi:hypothetical protein